MTLCASRLASCAFFSARSAASRILSTFARVLSMASLARWFLCSLCDNLLSYCFNSLSSLACSRGSAGVATAALSMLNPKSKGGLEYVSGVSSCAKLVLLLLFLAAVTKVSNDMSFGFCGVFRLANCAFMTLPGVEFIPTPPLPTIGVTPCPPLPFDFITAYTSCIANENASHVKLIAPLDRFRTISRISLSGKLALPRNATAFSAVTIPELFTSKVAKCFSYLRLSFSDIGLL